MSQHPNESALLARIEELEQQLKRQQAEFAPFHLMFENNPLPMWVYDIETLAFLAVNDTAIRRYGYTREEFLAMTIRDIRPAEDVASLEKNLSTFRSNYQESGPWRHMDKAGHIYLVNIISHGIQFGGKAARMVVAQDVTERNQAERALAASEARYRTLVNQLPAVVYSDDANGRTQFVSDSIETLLGYTPAEWMAGNFDLWRGCIHPDDRDWVSEEHLNCLVAGRPFDREYRLRTKTGEYLWVKDQFVMLRDANGLPLTLHGLIYDVTARKQAEDAIRRNELLLKQVGQMAHLGAWEIEYSNLDDLNANPLYWSDEVYRIFGYQPGAVEVSNDLFFAMSHPDDQQKISDAFREAVTLNKPYKIEHRIIRADGVERVVLENAVPVFGADGRLLRMFGAVQDITDIKQAELKIVESEYKYRSIIEQSSEGMALIAEDGTVLDWNQANEKITGLSNADVVGTTLWDLTVKLLLPEKQRSADPLVYQQQITQALKTGKSPLFEKPIEGVFLHKNTGQLVYFRQTVFPIQTEKGYRIASLTQDITERKLAEEALHKSEGLYRTLIESSDASIVTFDFTGNVHYANKIAADAMGLSEDEMRGKNMRELFPPGVSDSQLSTIRSVFESGKGFVTESPSSVAGRASWYRTSLQPVRGKDGEPELVMIYAVDITEFKQSEQALRESEEEYRQLAMALEERVRDRTAEIEATRQRLELAASAAGLGVWELDLQTEKLLWDERMHHLYGLQVGEFGGNLEHWQVFIHPDDLEKLEQKRKHAIELTGHYRHTFRVVRPDGSLRYISSNAKVVYGEDSQPLRMIGVNMDVTASELAEQALNESEQRLRLLFEESPDPLMVTDLDGVLIQVNKSFEALMGQPRSQMLGKNIGLTKTILEFDYASNPRGFRDYLNRTKSTPAEVTVLRPDGTHRLIETRSYLIHLNEQELALTSGRDVTERKRMEDRLRTLTYRLEMATRTAGIGVWEWDVQANKIIWDTRMYALYGVNTAEPMDTMAHWKKCIHPEDVEAWQGLEQVMAQKELEYVGEFRILWPDGTIRYIRSNAVILYGLDDNPERIVGVNLDLTDQKKSQESLQRSEATYRALFENAGDAIFLIDLDGSYVRVNSKAAELLGYTVAELTGKKAVDLIVPDQLDKAQDVLARLLAGETIPLYERFFRTKTGSVIETDINLSLIRKASGEPQLIQSVVRNITPRKHAEQILRDSEEQNRLLFEESPDAVLLVKMDGEVVKVNRAFEELTGYSRDSLVGYKTNELGLVPQDQGRRVVAAVKQAMVHDHTFSTAEYTLRRADGSLRFVESRNFSINIKGMQHVLTTMRDITRRKEAEQALRDSEAYARLLFDASPDPVSVTSLGGVILDVNRAFEIQYGVKREVVRNQTIADLRIFPEASLAQFNDYIKRTLNGEQVEPVELDFLHPSGMIHTLELHSYPIMAGDRQILLSTSRDISSHKRAEEFLRKSEESLRLANAEMERALRLKDEFLANMSHELRTPLNAILGLSESLDEQIAGPLTERQVKYVRIINESGRHLLTLINDILDLSKIGAGRMDLELQQTPLESLCQASLRMVKELAQKKNLEVIFTTDGQVEVVRVDDRRMKQVLVNLLSNAVKFTPNGGKIGVDVIGDTEKQAAVITVWDSGMGISPEDMPRLFQPFVQLDSGLAREYPGTGLGLALVAQMVRLHGGSVEVQSTPGEGSRFILTIPWNPAITTARPLPAEVEFASISQLQKGTLSGKVLLVEDTEAVWTIITDYLSAAGFQVIVAQDGSSGIVKAQTELPDIILMDIQMPGMDGFEATGKLRSIPALQNTPIIALTALAMRGDRERCIRAGMTDYISKPVNLKKLLDLVQRYTQQPGSGDQRSQL